MYQTCRNLLVEEKTIKNSEKKKEPGKEKNLPKFLKKRLKESHSNSEKNITTLLIFMIPVSFQ